MNPEEDINKTEKIQSLQKSHEEEISFEDEGEDLKPRSFKKEEE